MSESPSYADAFCQLLLMERNAEQAVEDMSWAEMSVTRDARGFVTGVVFPDASRAFHVKYGYFHADNSGVC